MTRDDHEAARVRADPLVVGLVQIHMLAAFGVRALAEVGSTALLACCSSQSAIRSLAARNIASFWAIRWRHSDAMPAFYDAAAIHFNGSTAGTTLQSRRTVESAVSLR